MFHFYIHQKSKCARQNNFSRGMRNKTIFHEAANENELMRFAKKCIKNEIKNSSSTFRKFKKNKKKLQ